MRFLIDAQLPPALARWLETVAGHAAEHVADLEMQGASDAAIWDFALREGCVIVTKDEDFAQRNTLVESGPKIVWIRLPNTRRGELIARIGRDWPHILAALERGETLIEVT